MSLFIQTLSRLNKGGSCEELDAHLARLTQQIRATGKAGSITIKLSIKPVNSDGEMVEISDKISIQEPDLPRRSSLFYTTEEGTLSRQNPNQAELPLESVEGGKSEDKITSISKAS